MLNEYESFVREKDALITFFINYTKNDLSLNKNDAENVLAIYIEESVISLGIESPLSEVDDKTRFVIAL